MRYVFLVYQDEASVAALEACRRDAIAGEAAAYREQLRDAGQLLAAAALDATALIVRTPNGALEIADGPRPAASERLTAVWLTEARDLNEAIRLAARMPEARLGSIEVRPLEQENGR